MINPMTKTLSQRKKIPLLKPVLIVSRPDVISVCVLAQANHERCVGWIKWPEKLTPVRVVVTHPQKDLLGWRIFILFRRTSKSWTWLLSHRLIRVKSKCRQIGVVRRRHSLVSPPVKIALPPKLKFAWKKQKTNEIQWLDVGHFKVSSTKSL